MDDVLLVRCLEGFGHLAGDGEEFVKGDRRGGDAIGKGGAIDEFHDDGALFNAEYGSDVGVIERGKDLRFAGEAGETIGVSGEGIWKDFDGDIAIELSVGGAVDSAHSAFAQFSGDAVMSDGLGEHESLYGITGPSAGPSEGCPGRSPGTLG